MADRTKFVFKDVTVVIGNDEEVNTTFVFLVKPKGGTVISFPRPGGSARDLTPDEMEKFLSGTPPSDMLSAIEDAWREMKIKQVVQ